MVWLTDAKKIENMFTRFNTIYERSRQMDIARQHSRTTKNN